jgi:hypothetical protein
MRFEVESGSFQIQQRKIGCGTSVICCTIREINGLVLARP